MATELVPSQLGTNSTLEKRIERVLDLTRRLKLLEDLLCTARARRWASEREVGFPGMDQAELDDNPDTCTTAIAQPCIAPPCIAKSWMS
jgi:hypothetical protein